MHFGAMWPAVARCTWIGELLSLNAHLHLYLWTGGLGSGGLGAEEVLFLRPKTETHLGGLR